MVGCIGLEFRFFIIGSRNNKKSLLFELSIEPLSCL